MADETSKEGTQERNCLILKGPNGELYLISDETLQAHRLPDEVATPLRRAYEVQAQKRSESDISTPAASFQILGQGPVVRRGSLTVPTMDTWFDMMTKPQPGKPRRS